MTNPSSPETRTDAHEAKEPSAPDGAKSAGDKPLPAAALAEKQDAENHTADKAAPAGKPASAPPGPVTPAPPTAASPSTPVAAAPKPRAEVKLRLFGRTDVGQVR